jgi:hypothetical protein
MQYGGWGQLCHSFSFHRRVGVPRHDHVHFVRTTPRPIARSFTSPFAGSLRGRRHDHVPIVPVSGACRRSRGGS